jgi:hypothetical protein
LATLNGSAMFFDPVDLGSYMDFSKTLTARSQAAFAKASVCDRITFARWGRQNRTAFLPFGEKGFKIPQLCRAGRIL